MMFLNMRSLVILCHRVSVDIIINHQSTVPILKNTRTEKPVPNPLEVPEIIMAHSSDLMTHKTCIHKKHVCLFLELRNGH